MRRAATALIALVLVLGLAAQLWQPTVRAPREPEAPEAPTPPEVPAPVPPPVAAPDQAPPTPAPVAPAFAPGEAVQIQLTEPPASSYLTAKQDDNDAFYRKLVQEESRGQAQYDADLARAAREFVYQYQNLGQDPPSDVRTFLTTSSGAIAGDTVFQHLRSNSEAEGALRQAIRAVLESSRRGSGVLHVGVGEVYQPGASLSRHIGVVGTRLGLDVTPLPRQVDLGQPWQLSGRLRAPWHNLSGLLLRPDDSLATVDVHVAGDRLTVDVPGHDKPGGVELQVIGEGPEGPGKLVQVRVENGQALPTTYRAVLPPDEAPIRTADDAAAYAFQLLNRDRKAHGVPELAWDDKLAAIAKDHSADMRDNGFFGHVSPTTGLHTDRLAKAHYLAATSAENVAHNPSVFEAELGLMHSLGHRRNLLDPQMTHVGLGVAGAEDEHGERRWWVTQLFAKPVPKWSDAEAASVVRARVVAEREARGLPALVAEPALDAVAAEAVGLAAKEALNEASNRALALAQARHTSPGRLRVWTALTPDVDQLEWPASLQQDSVRTLGLAASQRADGKVAIVLLLGE